ncbi:MAG: hypothetical protein OQK52_07480 [Ignavibacteriaceae bacterium]|jgi:hypothetical protein|nr:hypothetical protein [Chlorobium sp.]MCW8817694.1 hypothetical protein [Ignavibacteriaceae bacterium]MCW9094809.1 hypothetical protein [Ignavibacteriaceae bacterium]
MAEVKKVRLSLTGSTIQISQDPVSIKKDDQIVFEAGDDNLYTVIIPVPSISNLAKDYFNTVKSVLIYDVSIDSAGLTPTAKDVDTPSGGLGYTVIVSTSDNTYKTPPDVPPKIIINSAA